MSLSHYCLWAAQLYKGDNLWYVYCCHLAHWCPSVHAHACTQTLCTHTLHTLTCTLHAVSLDNKLLSFWKIQSKCQAIIVTNFEHFFGILSPHKILSKSSLCLDLLFSVTPLSLFFCPTPLLWVPWQIEWGWWWGSRKVFWFWLVL